MNLNLIGPFIVNAPFGTEIAFAKGLRRIGVNVNEVDPNLDKLLDGMDQSADATIVFKSCVGNEQHLRRLKGPVIIYQPDDARFPHIRQMLWDMRPYADFLLSFDDYGAGLAKTMGYRAAETLLLTADDELYCPAPTELVRDIDVCFIGSMGDLKAHASRRHMCELAKQLADTMHWKTVLGQSQDIPFVLEMYRRSKVVINHATDVGQPFGHGFGYQCRHFEVGMTRTALLSNQRANWVNDRSGPPFVSFEDSAEFTDRLAALVEGQHKDVADEIYEDIKVRHLPQHRAAQLVDFVLRIL